MKTIKIALTCLLVLASLPGISQSVAPAPANATASLGGPIMAMGSANDHAIQKLNMELTKVKAEFAQELGKVKKDITELTNSLAWQKANYVKHKHSYVKPMNGYIANKSALCNGVVCANPKITYEQYTSGETQGFVEPPVWQAGD